MAKFSKARNVKHHPLPIPAIMWSMAAVAAAPNIHRTRLLAAVAVAGACGLRSTIRVLRTLNEVGTNMPIRKTRTNGTATEVSTCKAHPYPISVAIPARSVG